MKKIPDNVVFNEKTSEFDAKNKSYPTNVGAPSFTPVIIDDTSSIKATKYFKSKLSEIEKDYKNTTLIYESDYNFEPIMGETYHLYEKINGRFLSLIAPNEWNKKYLGSYLLTTDGKWEKVNLK